MRNFLSDLIPGLHESDNPEAETLAQGVEHEAKADRIKFHRAHVRNGPTKFKVITAGQARRAEKRALARKTKKARRAQVRNYFETQRLASIVRGHLQLAGVLPFVAPVDLDRYRQVESTAWIVKRFSEGEVSYAHDDVLEALSRALRFYGEAVGLPGLKIPADYVVPIYEQGTHPEGARA